MVPPGQQEAENVSKNLYQRNGIWWARFKVNGTEYRESLRTRVLAKAEKRLKARKEQVEDESRYGISGPMSWQSAVVSWNEHSVSDLGEKTLARYLCSLEQLRPLLDNKMLHEIDGGLVREIVKARRKVGVTTATIRRDLTAMSSVIEHAIDEEWMDTNPTLAIRRKRLRERRDPVVLPQPASMAMILKASPARFADAQEFALETGMRQEEIFGLERQQLDAKAGTITLIGKGNKLRVIPYSRKAQEIVERQPPFLKSRIVFWHSDGDRWVSPGSRFGDIKRRVAQKAARDGTAFEPYRFHDYRHLYAVNYLRTRKGSIYDLRDLMGHSSVKVTEIYLDFLTPEEKKAAMHGVAQKRAREQRSGGKKQ